MTTMRCGELYVRYLHETEDNPVQEQPCPACHGRAEKDCLECGGEGYV